jgi:hypothetical protein
MFRSFGEIYCLRLQDDRFWSLWRWGKYFRPKRRNSRLLKDAETQKKEHKLINNRRENLKIYNVVSYLK